MSTRSAEKQWIRPDGASPLPPSDGGNPFVGRGSSDFCPIWPARWLPGQGDPSNLGGLHTSPRPESVDLTPSITIAGRSDVGMLRQRNEDSFQVLPDLGVAVVADGMGGHPGGDVASRIAAETAAGILARAVESDPEGDSGFVERFREIMREAVRGAQQAIREHVAEEPGLEGMGTTLTGMVVDPGTRAWIIGHVGDSRVYLYRSGELKQLTTDDTWVQEQIAEGHMSPASARLSPYAHLLTQCVGLDDEPVPELLDGTAEAGDAYLLCTDGLIAALDDARVASILRDATDDGDGDASLSRLIDEANEEGGPDNITAALVRFP